MRLPSTVPMSGTTPPAIFTRKERRKPRNRHDDGTTARDRIRARLREKEATNNGN